LAASGSNKAAAAAHSLHIDPIQFKKLFSDFDFEKAQCFDPNESERLKDIFVNCGTDRLKTCVEDLQALVARVERDRLIVLWEEMREFMSCASSRPSTTVNEESAALV